MRAVAREAVLLCSWPEPCPVVRYRLNGKKLSAGLGQRERPKRLKNASGMASDIRPASAPAQEEGHDQWWMSVENSAGLVTAERG